MEINYVAPDAEMKKVYSRPTEREAVLLTDLEGDSMEISGHDMKAAGGQAAALDKMYRRLALPYFCKDGGDLEVFSMATNRLLWTSVVS